MKMKLVFVTFFVCISCFLCAQQMPQHSLFLESPIVYNPAVTGTAGLLEFTAAFKKQWTGINDSPLTAFISGQALLKNEKTGIGGYVINDITGPMSYTDIGFNFSYQIYFGKVGKERVYLNEFNVLESRKLSFGISAGLAQLRLKGSELELTDAVDDAILSADGSKFYPNASFGIYYTSPEIYAGLSIPQLLNFDVTLESESQFSNVKKLQHYYFMGGAKFRIKDSRVSLEPNAWLKYVIGAPAQATLSLRTRMKKAGWLGLGYRTQKSLVLDGGIIIKSKVTIGYAFDFYLSDYSKILGQTHELTLNYKVVKNNR